VGKIWEVHKEEQREIVKTRTEINEINTKKGCNESVGSLKKLRPTNP
jgi:hypothetical protein